MEEINTMFNGRCLVLTVDGEVGGKKTFMLKLFPMGLQPGFMYIHKKGAAIGVAIAEWHSSQQSIPFSPLTYYEKELTKEYHSVLTRNDAPCLDRNELNYYKVVRK